MSPRKILAIGLISSLCWPVLCISYYLCSVPNTPLIWPILGAVFINILAISFIVLLEFGVSKRASQGTAASNPLLNLFRVIFVTLYWFISLGFTILFIGGLGSLPVSEVDYLMILNFGVNFIILTVTLVTAGIKAMLDRRKNTAA